MPRRTTGEGWGRVRDGNYGINEPSIVRLKSRTTTIIVFEAHAIRAWATGDNGDNSDRNEKHTRRICSKHQESVSVFRACNCRRLNASIATATTRHARYRKLAMTWGDDYE